MAYRMFLEMSLWYDSLAARSSSASTSPLTGSCEQIGINHGQSLQTMAYRAERSAEKEDVGLRAVIRIVLPSSALLHTNAAPLNLRHHTTLWQRLCHFLREDDMTVLEFGILVFVRVINLEKSKSEISRRHIQCKQHRELTFPLMSMLLNEGTSKKGDALFDEISSLSNPGNGLHFQTVTSQISRSGNLGLGCWMMTREKTS